MLLSIDTCGPVGSVALGRPDLAASRIEVLAKAELPGRAYSAHLMQKIAELLAEQHATIGEIEAIVVVNGPGSFTGIRVGLSTAKGLAEAMQIPIIALSRLALIAALSGLPHVLAVVDAGRGESYVGEYQGGRKLREVLLSGEEVLAAARQPGAGILVCEENCAASASGEPVYLQSPDAADALRMAFDRFRERSFENVEILDANYLRRSDAELFGAGHRSSANDPGANDPGAP